MDKSANWLDYDSDEDDKNIKISKLSIDESIEYKESKENNKQLELKETTAEQTNKMITRQDSKRKKEAVETSKQQQKAQMKNVLNEEKEISEAQWEKSFIDELSQSVLDISPPPASPPDMNKSYLNASFLQLSQDSNPDDLNQSIHELSQKLETSANGVQLVNNVIKTVISKTNSDNDDRVMQDVQNSQKKEKVIKIEKIKLITKAVKNEIQNISAQRKTSQRSSPCDSRDSNKSNSNVSNNSSTKSTLSKSDNKTKVTTKRIREISTGPEIWHSMDHYRELFRPDDNSIPLPKKARSSSQASSSFKKKSQQLSRYKSLFDQSITHTTTMIDSTPTSSKRCMSRKENESTKTLKRSMDFLEEEKELSNTKIRKTEILFDDSDDSIDGENSLNFLVKRDVKTNVVTPVASEPNTAVQIRKEENKKEIECNLGQTTANSSMQSPKTPLMTSTPFVKRFNHSLSSQIRKPEPIINEFLLTQYDLEINYDEIRQIEKEIELKDKTSKKDEQIGFAFASGKNIVVNDRVLSNIKDKFKKEEKKTVRFKEIDDNLSIGLCETTINSVIQLNESTLKSKAPPQNAFGFAFASGKNIAVNDQVLSNIKSKFQKEEEKVKFNEINESSLDDWPQTTTNITIQSPKTPLMTSTPFVKKSVQKTLSSKSLSSKSIANDYLLTQYDMEIDYDYIDQVEKEETLRNSKSNDNDLQNGFGFAFASGKNIAVNDKVLSNIKNKFQKEEEKVKFNDINESSLDDWPQTTTNITVQSPKTPLMTSTPFVKKSVQKFVPNIRDENNENHDITNNISTPTSSNKISLQPGISNSNQIPQKTIFDEETQIDYEVINDVCSKIEMAENVRFAREKELKNQIEFISKKTKVDEPQYNYGKLYIMKKQTNRLKLKNFHSNFKIKLKESMVNKCVPYSQIIHHLFDMSSYTNDPHNEIFVTIADDAKLVFNSKNSGMVGYNEIKHSFLAMRGIKARQLPDAWVKNAYEMIFWKLNFMENFLEKIDEHMALNPENILLQLKYRYDREIHRFESPSLRQILEKDIPASQRIVLKVLNISYTSANGYELELTDGWYKIKTLIDSCLADAIDKSKIQVHSKLLICNMELKQSMNDNNIFLLIESSTLKIYGNSTRLVNWDTKLGLCKIPIPFRITLDSVKNTGGLIGKLHVVITHVYSPVYVETVEDKRVYRSERMQNKFEVENEVVLQKMYERLREKVLDKILIELKKRHREILQYPKDKKLTIEDICDFFEVDTESEYALKLIENLSNADLVRINNIIVKRRSNLEDKIKILMKNESERQITQLIKFRAVDADNPKSERLICWWHPNEEVIEIIKQGKMVEMVRASTDNINIIGNQKTIIKELKKKQDMTKFDSYFRKETKFADINEDFSPMHNEFDIACAIIYIAEPSMYKNQEIFLADEHCNILCVNFYIDISEYAYDNVLTEGKILYVRNLQWRNSFRKPHLNIPEAFAVADLTTFVTNPAKLAEKQRVDELTNAINSNPEYMETCREKIVKLIGPVNFNKENSSKKYAFLEKIALPPKPPLHLCFSDD